MLRWWLMLTKAGKFKFNAETALHSLSLCVGAGGGEEIFKTSPLWWVRRGQPEGTTRGLVSLRDRVFGNFTDRRVEAELRLVPLCSGCEKGSNVHTIREQSCIDKMYFKGFHLKHWRSLTNWMGATLLCIETLRTPDTHYTAVVPISAVMVLLSFKNFVSSSLVLTIQKMNCDAGFFFLPWIICMVLDQVI